MPDVVLCTCGVMTGGLRSHNPGCPVHATPTNAANPLPLIPFQPLPNATAEPLWPKWRPES